MKSTAHPIATEAAEPFIALRSDARAFSLEIRPYDPQLRVGTWIWMFMPAVLIAGFAMIGRIDPGAFFTNLMVLIPMNLVLFSRALLWFGMGREQVRIIDGELTIERNMGVLSFTRTYSLEDVETIRAGFGRDSRWSHRHPGGLEAGRSRIYAENTPGVRFRVKGSRRDVTFAAGVAPEEAVRIAAAVGELRTLRGRMNFILRSSRRRRKDCSTPPELFLNGFY